MKKTWIIAAILLAAGAVFGDAIDDAEAKKRGVSVEVVQLERANKRVAALEQQVADLRAQIKAAQVKPATQPTAATQATHKTDLYMYQGNEITKERFSTLYRVFGTKMLYLDGKLIDTGESAAWDKKNLVQEAGRKPDYIPLVTVGDIQRGPGSVHFASGKVTEVTKDGIIVYLETEHTSIDDQIRFNRTGVSTTTMESVTYRIRGIELSKFAEGTNVDLPKIVYVGTCTVDGRTLQDYYLSPTPPTEAQFAEALKMGFVLNTWAIVEKGVGEAAAAVATPVK